jgi:ATP:corrinoid adenosyltransferase
MVQGQYPQWSYYIQKAMIGTAEFSESLKNKPPAKEIILAGSKNFALWF